MKLQNLQNQFLSRNFIITTVFIFCGLQNKISAQTNLISTNAAEIGYERILASVQPVKFFREFDETASECMEDRKKMVQKLTSIFNDPKSSKFQVCAAAFYLGELRASEAAEVLAHGKIYLELTGMENRLSLLQEQPIVEALIKIGTPSIPPLLRNLAESDEASIQAKSLQAIRRIDADKDITQLRLEKAIKAETDPKKQARLNAALQALPGMK